jgi:drug/metabolite transporter (DMT)-like permease
VTLPRLRLYAVLLAGIAAVSFASVIIRVTPAPSPLIASGRLVFSSLVLVPPFWATFPRRRAELAAVKWGVVGLSGLLLAAHFALWIESLRHTTVTSSVVLVALNPVFAAALSPLVLREKLSVRQWLAVGMGLVGAAVIAGPKLGTAGTSLGNLLALGGALCAAGYLMAGRRVRSGLSLLSYVYLIYTVAAVVLLVYAATRGTRFLGGDWRVYGLILLLALGPQLVGHTSFNYVLKYLPAPVVAMGVLGEPVGTSILAMVILREVPTPLEAAGGVIICAGIYLAATTVGRPVS